MKQLMAILALSFFAAAAQAKDNEIQISSATLENREFHFNFGQVPVRLRQSVVYTLTNRGSTDIEIRNVSIRGVDFSASTDCSKLLAAGDSCDTVISFWPSFEGFRSGRLVWETSSNNVILNLWGEGIRN